MYFMKNITTIKSIIPSIHDIDIYISYFITNIVLINYVPSQCKSTNYHKYIIYLFNVIVANTITMCKSECIHTIQLSKKLPKACNKE